MTSCKVVKLNPDKIVKFDGIINDIMERKKEGKKYGSIGDIPLCIYVINKSENDYGVEYDVVIDDYHYVWSYSEKDKPVKESKHISLQIYRKDLNHTIGIFGTRNYGDLFVKIINEISDDDTIILPVVFDLDSRKEAIKQNFPEIKRFSVEKIMDPHEKRASVSGLSLGRGHAWKRYVEIYEGKLTKIIVKHREMYISISEDGFIFCKKGIFEENKEQLVYEILMELKKLNALKIIEDS